MIVLFDDANKEWIILVISKTKSHKNLFSVVNC